MPTRHYPFWINILLLGVMILLGAATLALFTRPATAGLLPAGAQSSLLANYGPDPRGTPLAALDLRVVVEAQRDRLGDPATTETPGAATVTPVSLPDLLATPVLVVTLAPGQPTPTLWASPTALPTATPPPTSSPEPSPTPEASPTAPAALATATATLPPSAVPTRPLPTSAASSTPFVWPTSTRPVPATATDLPTLAPTQPPVETRPPENTAPPADPPTDVPPTETPPDTPPPPPPTEPPAPYEPPAPTEPPPAYP
ncbi:MAG: hypothetical protein JNK29_18325 [Anaerolineales bacterium]|nr:hypothetical protein [Anaerolineales bacterium]